MCIYVRFRTQGCSMCNKAWLQAIQICSLPDASGFGCCVDQWQNQLSKFPFQFCIFRLERQWNRTRDVLVYSSVTLRQKHPQAEQAASPSRAALQSIMSRLAPHSACPVRRSSTVWYLLQILHILKLASGPSLAIATELTCI